MPKDTPSHTDYSTQTVFTKTALSSYLGMQRVLFTFGASHPWTLMKTRMQANPAIHSCTLLASEIYQKTGIRGFYVGGLPGFVRAASGELYRSPTRGWMKSQLKSHHPSTSDPVINAVTGLGIATTDTFIMCPLERLKTWLITNSTHQQNITTYLKDWQAATDSYKYLIRGIELSYTRRVLGWSSYFVAEGAYRDRIAQLSPRVEKKSNLPLGENLLAGALAGITSMFITQPVDTVKTRMQMYHSMTIPPSIYDTIMSIYRQYGLHGFTAGWRARIVTSLIGGALSAWLIQRVDQVWEEDEQR